MVALAVRLRYTPFGRPVVPEVYSIVAPSTGSVRSAPSSLPSTSS